MFESFDRRYSKRTKLLSCAECRRLKLKCDRQVPCQNCVKRGCSGICPDGSRQSTSKPSVEAVNALQRRVAELESFIKKGGASDTSPSDRPDVTLLDSSGIEGYGSFVRNETVGLQETYPMVSGSGQTTRPDDQTAGSLILSPSGHSKYMGPSAAVEWLKESNAPTSESAESTDDDLAAFPFNEPRLGSTACFRSKLPLLEDRQRVIDCYFRYFAWSFDIVPRATITRLSESEPTQKEDGPERRAQLQELGLLYAVLAMGTVYNLEIPPEDPSSEVFHAMTQQCLARGEFMTHNTIAGVQALQIMAQYRLETEKGRNGDSAWPLWGLSMGIVQAMGLHRDGEKWNLPADVVEERRRVFWHCRSAEVFQANCFSRPVSMISAYYDTAPPTSGQKEFVWFKLELCRISEDILDHGLRTVKRPFSSVTAMYQRLCDLERAIPYPLRSREAFSTLASVRDGSLDAPPVNKANFQLTCQQHSLALIISINVVHLYRPYFMQAIADCPGDPASSPHGQAFASIVERCGLIIRLTKQMYKLYPAVTVRIWYYWFHAFGSAGCLGTLILMTPRHPLVSSALTQMNEVIELFFDLTRNRPSIRLRQNLDWLLSLRRRATARMDECAGATDCSVLPGEQPTTTMTQGSSILDLLDLPHYNIAGASQSAGDDSADDLLSQFWDPLWSQGQSGMPWVDNLLQGWDGRGSDFGQSSM